MVQRQGLCRLPHVELRTSFCAMSSRRRPSLTLGKVLPLQEYRQKMKRGECETELVLSAEPPACCCWLLRCLLYIVSTALAPPTMPVAE